MGDINTQFFKDLDEKATWSAGVAFKRSNPLPLDKYSVFATKTDAETYASSNAVAYPGQVVAVQEGKKMVAYVLAENTDGTALELQQIGIIPTGDGKTISVTEEGKISLLVAEGDTDAGSQLTLQADGTIKWVKPDTTTVEGQSAAIKALEDTVNGTETTDGLVDKVGVKASEGVEATGLYKLIADEVARATDAEDKLDKAIKAIDFIDSDELADAIKDFVTSSTLATELAKKLDLEAYNTDKKALDDKDVELAAAAKAAQDAADKAQETIDEFLTGEGIDPEVIENLKEIQAALKELANAEEMLTALAGKADKVTGATAGNFAGLDENGNLVDSGKKAADFATPADVKAVDDKFAGYTNTADLTTLLAGKQDNIPENTYDTYGSAADAEDAAKAYTDEQLESYYNKDEIVGLDYATNKQVSDAVAAEAEIARAAEKTNKDAIDAIKEGATIVTFKGVEEALDGKQAAGDYATNTALNTAVQTLEGSIATTLEKAQKGVDDAKTAQEAAEAAQATANTNAANTDELEKVLYGRVITGDETYPETVDSGLIGDVSDVRTRMATAEGVITNLQGASHTHAKTDTEISDAVDKKHTHANKDELDKINDGDVAKWNAAEKNAKDYADGLADNYAKASHEHTKSEITDFAHTHEIGEVNGLSDAIADAKKAGTDAAGALDAYKGEMTTTLAGVATDISNAAKAGTDAAAQALEDAKKYADENDADTQYGIEYDSVTKKIKLTSDTSKTEIDATAFIKDGMIESVALSEDGLNLVITWNTDSDKGENNVTTIPLSGLVDVYTGVDGTTVKVEVSSDNKISAEVKAGTVTNDHIADDAAIAKTKLASDVQTSLGKADTAVQPGDIGTMASEAAADYVKKSDAVGYTDILTKTEAATTYATVAQGEKADSAIQTVAAGTGLTATVDENDATKVTIDLDETVVFVFDGGSATSEW